MTRGFLKVVENSGGMLVKNTISGKFNQNYWESWCFINKYRQISAVFWDPGEVLEISPETLEISVLEKKIFVPISRNSEVGSNDMTYSEHDPKLILIISQY